VKSASVGSLAKYSRKAESYASFAGRWWLREFLALFPERTSEWLAGPGRATLILAIEGDARVAEEFTAAQNIPTRLTRFSKSDQALVLKAGYAHATSRIRKWFGPENGGPADIPDGAWPTP
jgi:hypothetical protein